MQRLRSLVGWDKAQTAATPAQMVIPRLPLGAPQLFEDQDSCSWCVTVRTGGELLETRAEGHRYTLRLYRGSKLQFLAFGSPEEGD